MFVRFVTSNIVIGLATEFNASVTCSVEPGHQISECIECVRIRDVRLETLICKLDEREFIIRGMDSLLCNFEHKDRRNLRGVNFDEK